jgi:hypothetical protein
VGQPIRERFDRIHDELPRANDANIKLAIQAMLELNKVEQFDHDAEVKALQNLLHALKRAEALSGQTDMSVAEAEAYLHGLAASGNEEAKALLPAFSDPFTGFD